MTISIETVVARIPDWRGKQVEIKPLSGGLTNTNYRVEVDGTPHFVRVPGENTDLLAIDRRNEYYDSKRWRSFCHGLPARAFPIGPSAPSSRSARRV